MPVTTTTTASGPTELTSLLAVESQSSPIERKPNPRFYHATYFLVASGMIGFAFLSTLYMHSDLKKTKLNNTLVGIIDALTFFTAWTGKFAVVLYFAVGPATSGMQAVFSEHRLPDYFTEMRTKSLSAKLLRLYGLFFGTIAAFFWAGLVAVSFQKSSVILKEFDNAHLDSLADFLATPAAYGFPAVASFCVNLLAWPLVVENGHKDIINFFRCSWRHTDWKAWHGYNKLLGEIKLLMEDPKAETPTINELYRSATKTANESSLSPNKKLKSLLTIDVKVMASHFTSLVENDASINFRVQIANSVPYQLVGLMLASASVFVGIAGFWNVFGLFQNILTEWGFSAFPRDFGATSVFWTIILAAFIMMPAVTNGLLDTLLHGKSIHLFSDRIFKIIALSTAFIALLSGAANAEQSIINGGSFVDALIALLASAAQDGFGLFAFFVMLAAQSAAKKYKLESNERKGDSEQGEEEYNMYNMFEIVREKLDPSEIQIEPDAIYQQLSHLG